MTFKIFYAWQSDRPNNLNRGLIRKALDDAVKELAADPDIVDVIRDAEVDQDTQGVAGSPSIAEAIFQKIRDCDVFVGDLTLVTPDDAGRPAPNPNVLVEYGYALHALGEQRILAVFNTAFGAVEALPFDIKHRRCMTYNAGDESESEPAVEARRQSRKDLSKIFHAALKAVATSVAADVPTDTGKEMVELPPQPASGARSTLPTGEEGISTNFDLPTFPEESPPQTGLRFLYSNSIPHPWLDGDLGICENLLFPDERPTIAVPIVPHVYLRFEPQTRGKNLSNVQAMTLARSGLSTLMGRFSGGVDYARNFAGPVAFSFAAGDPNIPVSATQLFRSGGDLWGVNFALLDYVSRGAGDKGKFVPTTAVEELLIDGLISYARFAKEKLELPTPIRVTAGLAGIRGYRLAVSSGAVGAQFVGHIFENTIAEQFDLMNFDFDPFELLVPLFNKIYDAAGIERPDTRTVGRSQR